MSLKALFLGYGRMGGALGEAWLQTGLVRQIDAVDPHRKGDFLAEIHRDATQLPETDYDLVVLAVKPTMVHESLQGVDPARLANALIISVMAGVTCASIAAALPVPRPVVRSMPNTPVTVRQGCTGLYGNADVTPTLRRIVSNLFDTVGLAVWLEDEEQLHALTAISGSGPAYYHLFSEALTDAGVKLGLPRELASQLAAQTALGAATLQNQEGADFAALRQAVTSPGGTTHYAIQVYEKDAALRNLVTDATAAARARSLELAKG
ncbi:MAG: pyrroline-5-carboxylate reductase [Lautropia sp.]|nr:pyrroline-5-carboxylate reductase [Lautropia sp.]